MAQLSESSEDGVRPARRDWTAKMARNPTIRIMGRISGRSIIRKSPGTSDAVGMKRGLSVHSRRVKPGQNRGALPRRRLALALATLGYSCAPSAQAPQPLSSPPPTPAEVYVSPKGSPGAEGSRSFPVQRIEEALARPDVAVVRLLDGQFRGTEVLIHRPVALEGAGSATISAHLFVGSDSVSIRNLTFTNGLSVGLAEHVELEGLSLSAGARDQALAIHRSSVAIRDSQVKGGRQASVQITSSTVAADRLSVAGAPALRGIRVDGGRLTAQDSVVQGGAYATVQATGSATVALSESLMGPTPGNGVVLLDGAQAKLTACRVAGAGKFGLLVRKAQLQVVSSTVVAVGEAAIGNTGGRVAVEGGLYEAGVSGAVVLSAFQDRQPSADLRSVRLSHRSSPALVVGDGVALVHASTLSSPARPFRLDGADTSTPAAPYRSAAVVVDGPRSRLSMRGTRVIRPSGPGIEAFNDAQLLLEDVLIHRSGQDGIVLSDLRAQSVRIDSTIVKGCQTGAGLRILDSGTIEINDLSVTGCPAGGLVVGQRAGVAVDGARIEGGKLGLAAFGGSTLSVRNASVSASLWSIFGACSDEVELFDEGFNHLSGNAIMCP